MEFCLALESGDPAISSNQYPVIYLHFKKPYFQIIQFSDGAYFAFPPEPTFTSTFAEFKGVGIFNTTLLAYNLGEKFALTLILYSTRVFPISVTTGCTLKGKLTFSVVRYLHEMMSISSHFVNNTDNSYFINSNSPSGGTKLMLLSLSNLPNLTHWWNWQSSISTALARRALHIHCYSKYPPTYLF